MKKWIFAGVLLVILIAVTSLALYNLNSLIKQNQAYLIAQAEQALGRDIQIGNIGVTLWGGIGARLQRFSIADDRMFSSEPFVRAADLQVNVSFFPLFRKELQISRMILHRPVINIIRNKEGRFNFSTIGGAPRPKAKGEDAKSTTDKRADRTAPPPLLIALVDVDDGEVRYTDKSQGLDIRVTRLDSRVKQIGLDRPIDVELSAAVFGADKQNLGLEARAGPLGAEADLSRMPIRGEIQIDPVPVSELEKSLPGFKRRLPPGVAITGLVGAEARFSGPIDPKTPPKITGVLNLSRVTARMPQLAQPITDLNAKVRFTANSAELPETAVRIGQSEIRLAAKVRNFSPLELTYRLSAPTLHLADFRAETAPRDKPAIVRNLNSEGTMSVQNGAVNVRGNLDSSAGTLGGGDYTNLRTAVSLAGRVATIESLSLNAFGGSLKGKGRYDTRESPPRFTAITTIDAMDLTEIFRALLPSAPQNLRGRIHMDLDVTGVGQEWSTIEKTLKGQGKAEVVNGELLDVNLAESVLGDASGLIPSDIRRKYPEIFSAKDTAFKEMKGSATIRDGKAYTDDLVVSAAEFESHGKGWFAFDRTVDMRGVLFLSSRLSQDIIARARPARGLANEQGQITVPFTMAGKLPRAKPRPDAGYIARGLQQGALEQGLDRLFRRRSPKRGSETTPYRDESGETKKRDPAEQILRGLEKFFGS
jgi:AsmA protein